ncbi:uncharacterized protein [Anabrus simplex]|uniref:uncharacterized protein n=1 Tax=Anabrus simplex TaxID=316456 RepID=UPI0035A2FC93
MDIRFESGFSLAEALDIIYNDDIDGDVFIEPPIPNIDTDEDSGNEDEGGLADNLTSRQLLANAEIKLSNEGAGRPAVSRTSLSGRISDSVRLDKTDHLVQHTEGKKRKRCANENCKSSVRTMCLKCGVGLCIDCFVPLHTG